MLNPRQLADYAVKTVEALDAIKALSDEDRLAVLQVSTSIIDARVTQIDLTKKNVYLNNLLSGSQLSKIAQKLGT